MLLTTFLDTSLTLPKCFFCVIMLDDPPWASGTLVSSESIREIDPEVVPDFGGNGLVICYTAASASVQTASFSAVEG